MARSKAETDELLLAALEWADADPDASLIVATVREGAGAADTFITLGHAALTVVAAMTLVAELLDVAEEQILEGADLATFQRPDLARIRAGRDVLGFRRAETLQ